MKEKKTIYLDCCCQNEVLRVECPHCRIAFSRTRSDQVRQIGNAVPYHVAKALAACVIESVA